MRQAQRLKSSFLARETRPGGVSHQLILVYEEAAGVAAAACLWEDVLVPEPFQEGFRYDHAAGLHGPDALQKELEHQYTTLGFEIHKPGLSGDPYPQSAPPPLPCLLGPARFKPAKTATLGPAVRSRRYKSPSGVEVVYSESRSANGRYAHMSGEDIDRGTGEAFRWRLVHICQLSGAEEFWAQLDAHAEARGWKRVASVGPSASYVHDHSGRMH